ncbi:hypothetical protein E2C01_100854 [Portunus trituberculatus]|uniref:Uncharacterized protein n=1 Tax=Portunus trituberculatus TaxID=210409 RepID=A0A5B7KE41_PORTR|nr:hypothetical protein [Portunus trituberculatus]
MQVLAVDSNASQVKHCTTTTTTTTTTCITRYQAKVTPPETPASRLTTVLCITAIYSSVFVPPPHGLALPVRHTPTPHLPTSSPRSTCPCLPPDTNPPTSPRPPEVHNLAAFLAEKIKKYLTERLAASASPPHLRRDN